MNRSIKILGVLLIGVAITCLGQIAPTSSLTGVVTDPSGSVVPNAQITLRNLETGFERKISASDTGQYLFNAVPVGLYSIHSEAPGFQAYQQTGIRLNVNTPATVNIRLSVGGMTEQVTVTADAAMVNTQSGTLSQVVQQRYLTDLPLTGRTAATLIRMVPGPVSGVGTTQAG